MKTRRYFKQLLLASSIVSLGLYAAPSAQAAFEWTPPKKVQQPPAAIAEEAGDMDADMMPSAPVEDVQAEDPLSEIPVEEQAPVEYINDNEVQEDLKEIIEEAEEKNNITPVAEIPESEKIDTLPENAVVAEPPPAPISDADVTEAAAEAEEVMEEPQPEAPVVVAEPEPEMDNMPDPNMVQGFGKDLPLIMAVRQIVPTDTPYAFGESLDLSQPVSWQGGASWQDTLKAIADENNLEVAFGDEMVRISNMNTAIAPAVQPEIETIRLESIQESEEVMPQETEEVAEVIMESDDVPVSDELKEEVAETPDMTPAAEKADIVIVADEQSENEVLEASISDAIVISPIEDMAPMPIVPQSEGNDALSEVTEGAVIGRIDEPQAPSQETLESASEKMVAMPVEMEEEPVVIETIEEVVVEETPDMVKQETTEIVVIEEDDEIQAVIETTMSEEIEMQEVEDPSISDMDDVVDAMAAEEQQMVQPMAEAMPLQITEPAPIAVADNSPIESDLTESMPEVQVAAAATAPAQMMSSEKLEMVKTWKVKKNSDLKQTLQNWSEEVGVNLQWKMDKDYSVNYMVWVDGNFEEAVDVLMQGYENEQGLIPAASLQMDTTGPVLVIEPAA